MRLTCARQQNYRFALKWACIPTEDDNGKPSVTSSSTARIAEGESAVAPKREAPGQQEQQGDQKITRQVHLAVNLISWWEINTWQQDDQRRQAHPKQERKVEQNKNPSN